MTRSREAIWTLDELCAEVALALASRDAGAEGYSGQASGRVRDVPDARTVRYYTTLGLVDRPTVLKGRTGYYGVRHLLQLVAIKRLQTHGLTLAQVQEQVVGRTDAALAELARLPADWLQGRPKPAGDAAEKPPDRSESFWKPAGAGEEDGEQRAGEGRAESPRPVGLVGVPLGEGVTLLFEAIRAVDDLDRESLQAAAAPLLKLLRTRRLLATRESRPSGESERRPGEPSGNMEERP